jgi:hypothetical protein
MAPQSWLRGQIYDSEINIEIGWLWDGGIEVRLGREPDFHGRDFLGSKRPSHTSFPSTYASSLDPEVRERGAKRIFLPARVGATVTCPHCGAPNASAGFDEVMIFYCARCRNSVEAKEPRSTDTPGCAGRGTALIISIIGD